MLCRTRWTTPLLMLVLGACNGLLPEVSESSGDPSSTGAVTTTTAETTNTTPGEDTVGTQGVTTTGTTSSVDGTSTSDDSTSDGASSSSGEMPECDELEDCGSSGDCNLETGMCEPICPGGWSVHGNYDYCLNEYGLFDTNVLCGALFPDTTCIFFGDPIQAATCSLQNCTDVCECPEPPPTGNATVTCGQITSAKSPNDCYLSCSDGEMCPDGMVCEEIGETGEIGVCVTESQPLAMYGNCNNTTGGCADGICTDEGGFGLCVSTCMNASTCDPSPRKVLTMPSVVERVHRPRGMNVTSHATTTDNAHSGWSALKTV